MHKFISFNRQIISPENTFLPAISSAAFYGNGIFSTVPIYHAKPFLWEKHWRRLTDNAKKIDVDLSGISEESVKNSLLEIIRINYLQNGRARITFFNQTLDGVWSFTPERKTSILIVTAGLRKLKKHFSLTTSPFRLHSLSPLVNVKSCNYLEKLLALKDAKKRGFDEAVLVNEHDEVVSASTSNIFWVKNEKLFTSSLNTGCLAGTIREFISENFTVCENQAGVNEILNADEVFLTSSGIGVMKVRNLESKCYASFKAAENLQRFLKNSI